MLAWDSSFDGRGPGAPVTKEGTQAVEQAAEETTPAARESMQLFSALQGMIS